MRRNGFRPWPAGASRSSRSPALVNAWLRLGGLGGLTSAYGALIMIKVVALLLLGVAGLEQRQRVIGRLGTDPQSRALFARLAAGELVVMGVAIGIAVALARSAPPVPDKPLGDITPAQTLTGYPMPPALNAARWVTPVAGRPAVAVARRAGGRLVPGVGPPAGAAR